MAENITVNGVTYNGVDVIEAETPEGKSVGFYPDAVRYSVQRLTDEQKAQARSNIGAVNGVFVPEVDSEGNLEWSFSDASEPIITIGANIRGPEGPEGPAGKNGWTPVPVIDADGWLYFNLQRVERPDPEPAVNIVDMVLERLPAEPDDPSEDVGSDIYRYVIRYNVSHTEYGDMVATTDNFADIKEKFDNGAELYAYDGTTTLPLVELTDSAAVFSATSERNGVLWNTTFTLASTGASYTEGEFNKEGPAGPKGDTGERGPAGATGPQGPAYELTDEDKAKITEAVLSSLPIYNGEVIPI